MIGVVIIGRNEGERLVRCLASLPPFTEFRKVYVDSGSTDGSVSVAKRSGVEVLELDPKAPFTAARARREGLALLGERAPELSFALVLDGDCELATGFVFAALARLHANPAVAVVCGRRRERAPEASVYNRLCDMEWDTPVGLTDACGGDAMLRLAAVASVGSYDPALIAGEEPELCFRLRRAGHLILRIDQEMTLHDAAMTTFAAFFRRAMRAGFAYAEVCARHGYWAREVRSVVFYTVVVPLAAATLLWYFPPAALVPLAAYPLLYARIAGGRRARGDGPRESALYARFCIAAKFAHLAGMTRWAAARLSRRRASIIEYKPVAPAKAPP